MRSYSSEEKPEASALYCTGGMGPSEFGPKHLICP